MTEPTDSEILDAADYFRPQYMHGGITFDEFDSIGFARAVLAKWGTPPAVAGEQTMADVIAACNGTEAFGLIMGLRAQVALLEAVIDEQKASAKSQPTQAQAGAVPLTDGVSVEAYRVGGLKVERARQMKSDDLWAVRDELKNVLNISGGLEWEPSPSGRDAAFLQRCRFALLEDAIQAARNYQSEEGGQHAE